MSRYRLILLILVGLCLAVAPTAAATGRSLAGSRTVGTVHAVGTSTVVNDLGETLNHDLDIWYQDVGTYRVVVTREDGTVSQELTVVDDMVYMVGRDPGGNPVVVFKEHRPATVNGEPVQVTFAVRPANAATDSRRSVDVHASSATIGLATAWDVSTDVAALNVSYDEVEQSRLSAIVVPEPPAELSEWPAMSEEPREPSDQELLDDAFVDALSDVFSGNPGVSGAAILGSRFGAPFMLPLHFATHFEGWKYFSTCARYYNYRSTVPGYFSGQTESTDLENCRYLGVALYGANVSYTCNWVYWWGASFQQTYASAYKSVTNKWPTTPPPADHSCSSHVAFNRDYVQTYGYTSNKNSLAG